jgi:hypothetical protein
VGIGLRASGNRRLYNPLGKGPFAILSWFARRRYQRRHYQTELRIGIPFYVSRRRPVQLHCGALVPVKTLTLADAKTDVANGFSAKRFFNFRKMSILPIGFLKLVAPHSRNAFYQVEPTLVKQNGGQPQQLQKWPHRQ